MSISSALSNALSGLTASARRADVVSSNIANAMTEGYGTRRLDTGTQVVGNDGSGVRVVGVTRQEDQILLGQRRQATAALNADQTFAEFATRVETFFGTPDQIGSLSGQIAEFEASLVSAANEPWNTTLLSGAVTSAQSAAETINNISDNIQTERHRADAEIGIAVEKINMSLESLSDLNKRILSAQANSGEIAALQDAQARLVEEIAPFIPLQTRRENDGTLRMYSNDGHVLLSHRAVELGFDPAAGMDPHLTLSNNTISGLTIDGRELRLEGSLPAFVGGELSALFQVRDTLGPEAQARIDAFARDLAERFDMAGFDPTVAPGDPGLFTDAGSLTDPVNEVGLAGRLQINSAVLPESGGAVWRLRDGIGSVVEGATGNASFLQAQVTALSAEKPTVSGGFTFTSRSISELAAEALSLTGLSRMSAESSLSQSANLNSALEIAELAHGVDTDDELQRLLKIEQSYAANARVISVAEEMMDELMRIAQ